MRFQKQIIENYNTSGINIPKTYAPFSPDDIQHYMQDNITGYVVDASKHKFMYKPKNVPTGFQRSFIKDYKNFERTAIKEQEFDKAYSESIDYLKKSDFNKQMANELINKSNNLQMEYTTNICFCKQPFNHSTFQPFNRSTNSLKSYQQPLRLA